MSEYISELAKSYTLGFFMIYKNLEHIDELLRFLNRSLSLGL